MVPLQVPVTTRGQMGIFVRVGWTVPCSLVRLNEKRVLAHVVLKTLFGLLLFFY
jgi:hypothetical protein